MLASVAVLAAEMVVCVGYCEADGDDRYNAAVCVCGDGVLGRHRKVHLPAGEVAASPWLATASPRSTPRRGASGC